MGQSVRLPTIILVFRKHGDALGSEKHQNRYRVEIGELVQQRWPNAPIVFEYYPESYTPAALRSARDFATEMHASFIHENFDGQGNDALIEELLEKIGYRLVLKEITYTSALKPGQTFLFEMTWENIGLAPPYFKTWPLVIFITDPQNNVVLAEQQLTPNIRTWLPNEPVQLSGTLATPTTLAPGDYTLRLAFVDPTSRQPALTLAIDGRDDQGRYLIGPVKVLP
jgi:hypothetical protein